MIRGGETSIQPHPISLNRIERGKKNLDWFEQTPATKQPNGIGRVFLLLVFSRGAQAGERSIVVYAGNAI
jgi:hypothetical protein